MLTLAKVEDEASERTITDVALIVFGFIALVLLVMPKDNFSVTRREREAVLRTDLRTTGDAIDNYTLDRKQRPHSLQAL